MFFIISIFFYKNPLFHAKNLTLYAIKLAYFHKENIEEIILILYYMFDFIRGEEQKMLKNTIMWTVITALLTALVYVELAVSGLMYVNIFTAISAIISIIVSVKEKKYIYILINIVLMFIALISYIVMY